MTEILLEMELDSKGVLIWHRVHEEMKGLPRAWVRNMRSQSATRKFSSFQPLTTRQQSNIA